MTRLDSLALPDVGAGNRGRRVFIDGRDGQSVIDSPQLVLRYFSYINMHAIALHLQLCACRAPLISAAATAASSSASAVDPSPPWGVSAGERQESGLEPGAGAGAGAGIWEEALGPQPPPLLLSLALTATPRLGGASFAAIATRQRWRSPPTTQLATALGKAPKPLSSSRNLVPVPGIVGDGAAAARVR
jgi:hypothetical protein